MVDAHDHDLRWIFTQPVEHPVGAAPSGPDTTEFALQGRAHTAWFDNEGGGEEVDHRGGNGLRQPLGQRASRRRPLSAKQGLDLDGALLDRRRLVFDRYGRKKVAAQGRAEVRPGSGRVADFETGYHGDPHEGAIGAVTPGRGIGTCAAAGPNRRSRSRSS
jgi:hypothetical protein